MLVTQVKELDARDWLLLKKRQEKRDKLRGPNVGDIVIFNDGTVRRISHMWPDGCQTSDEGSFYFSSTGWMSFSGGLHGVIPFDTLTRVGSAAAPAWFFHHEVHQAHNGVDVLVDVKVFTANIPPN